jgi:hypothetical protein
MTSKMRRGFTLAADNVTIVFLPSEGSLSIQSFVEHGDATAHGRMVLDTSQLQAFMRDLRRTVKDAVGADDEAGDNGPLFVNGDGTSGGESPQPVAADVPRGKKT